MMLGLNNAFSVSYALVPLYWFLIYKAGDFKSDHFVLGAAVMALSLPMKWVRDFRALLLPFALTGIVYDAQRYYVPLLRARIRVAEPYEWEKSWFGIGGLTPNEWWQQHTHWILDFVCGFFYLAFLALFLLTAFYFIFREGRRNAWVRARAPRMMWSFFWVNILGYSTYLWYAAAPPWYVSLYGFGEADLNTAASAAGALRFDQMLGINVFQGMYAKSTNIFGAIPSLHVSYPAIALYFALKFRSLRVFCAVFYGMMLFSAVYLNHHYIIDVIWGSAYAFLVCVIVDRLSEYKVTMHREVEKQSNQD